MSNIIERSLGFAADAMKPVAEIKTARDKRVAETTVQTPEELYTKHLVAMHEFPEVLPHVWDMAERVEAGEATYGDAHDFFNFLALSVIAGDTIEKLR